jgi:hypothetical protein
MHITNCITILHLFSISIKNTQDFKWVTTYLGLGSCRPTTDSTTPESCSMRLPASGLPVRPRNPLCLRLGAARVPRIVGIGDAM